MNSSSGVSFHKFPDDPTLLAAWIDKIPREFHRTLPKQARVCSKHFCELDYVTESFDSNATRRKQRQSVKKKLKPTAIPHVFEGCPRYLTSHCSFASKRTTPMEREKKMEIREEARFADFLEEDRVRTLTDIMNKLDRSMVTGFIHQCVENILSFHCISTTNQDSSPELKCSLLISSDLSFSAFSNGKALKYRLFSKLIEAANGNKITSMTALSNVLAALKALTNSDECDTSSLQLLKESINLLKKFMELPDVDDKSTALLLFITDQLSLIQSNDHGKRYSANTFITCFSLYSVSSSCYKSLSKFFQLPTVRRLKQLSQGFCPSQGNVDLTYLESRVKNLTSLEKNVILMVDEIYTSERIEYDNGSFVGYTEEGAVAKTVLAFMIKSVTGHHQDMVALYPVDKLDAHGLEDKCMKVLSMINDLYYVHAICVDNHAVNRAFYHNLCSCGCSNSESLLKPFIDNRFSPDRRLYLLFDTTHNLKNIFNNWINRKKFTVPMNDSQISPNFSDIVAVYNKERRIPLKIAHKLSKTSLNPNGIAKTSVKHACSK